MSSGLYEQPQLGWLDFTGRDCGPGGNYLAMAGTKIGGPMVCMSNGIAFSVAVLAMVVVVGLVAIALARVERAEKGSNPNG